MIRRGWFVVLMLAVLPLVVTVLGLTHLRARSASSRLPERGLITEIAPRCPARSQVLFDDRGIPHVFASSEAAVWFSQGYLHAQDRFFQMEMMRRTAAGRLAGLLGSSGLESDRKMRILRLAASARRQRAQLSADESAVLEAYAAGVNAALERYGRWIAPEIWLLGLDPEPWQIEDSLSIGLLLQLDLSWAMGEELKRAVELASLGRERAISLWGWTSDQARDWIPPGDGIRQPRRDHEAITPAMGGVGSNSWVVGPELSATGRPLLANDPHLGVQIPGTFFAIHLQGPRTDVAGGSMAGLPGVIIGHTKHVAWGLTLAMLDDQDLFVLTLDDSGDRELIDGRWSHLRTVTENIVVRWQPEPVLLKIRLSVNGPLVREGGGESLALSWAAFNGPSMLPAILGMNRASSVEDVASAWNDVLSPSLCLVAADTSGHILHQVVGRAPERRRGGGRLPAPGSDSRWAWRGFRPLSSKLRRLDPSDGILATANHDLFAEGDFPERDRLPGDFAPPWRVRRIRSVLASRSEWTVDGFAELQGDVQSGRAIAILKQLWTDFENHGGRSAQELMSWDARMDANSTAAALFSTFMIELGEAVAGDEARRDRLDWNPLGSDGLLRLLAGGLEEAWWDDVGADGQQSRAEIVGQVLDRMDRAAPGPTWGAVHKVAFEHPLAQAPGVGRLVANSWSRGPFAVGGDNVTVNATCWDVDRPFTVTSLPAMRFVTEVGDWDETILILPVGESGRPWSPHYADQIDSWLNIGTDRFPFSREAVEAVAVAELELVPVDAEATREVTAR